MRHRHLSLLLSAVMLSTSLVPPALAGTVMPVDPAEHAATAVPGGEAGVPVDHVVGDLAFVGGPPRHHGRDPGPGSVRVLRPEDP